MCSGSSNLFGSVGLRKKQYCILNKQYSKNEFESLRKKIINHMSEMPYISRKSQIPNHKSQINSKDRNSNIQTEEIIYRYGEFFPAEISPFAYNETSAQEYFPLTKDEAITQGFSWRDARERNVKLTLNAKDLPDRIEEAPKTITSELIGCIHETKCNDQCTGVFRIIPKEVTFYKKMNLPLPRLCPRCRHFGRLRQRTPLALWQRPCQCAGEKSDNSAYKNTSSHFHKNEHCSNEFETTYPEAWREIIYCEACYQNEFL
ncbi:MAG: hypothetical protein HYZ69_03560, partial [Candidatus Colwellbacteria bacterium]|nr:hypothetical protein [Candidatus Colwellbacteria bacterium]